MSHSESENTDGGDKVDEGLLSTLGRLALPAPVSELDDVFFLVVHAIVTAAAEHGFKLVGLGDCGNPVQEGRLPEDWNRVRGVYSFRYEQVGRSLALVVKAMTVGSNRQLLSARALEREEGRASSAAQLELSVGEYVDEAKFLDEAKLQREKGEVGLDWSKFLRGDRVAELIGVIRRELVGKFVAPAGEEEEKGVQTAQIRALSANNNNGTDWRGRHRQSPRVPDQAHPPLGEVVGGRFRYGDQDLLPGGLPRRLGEGGSSMGPNYPGFGGGVSDPYYGETFQGVYRGVRMPPPGARFDPFGPPGMGDPFPDARSRDAWMRERPDARGARELPDPDHQTPPGFDNDDMYL